MPPLIKQEIKANPLQEDFILGYMVNDGYAEDFSPTQKFPAGNALLLG
jgi:hypothetical protein